MDTSGLAVTYVYYEVGRCKVANLMTRDTANIVKLLRNSDSPSR
jgi:hypothetical protein